LNMLKVVIHDISCSRFLLDGRIEKLVKSPATQPATDKKSTSEY